MSYIENNSVIERVNTQEEHEYQQSLLLNKRLLQIAWVVIGSLFLSTVLAVFLYGPRTITILTISMIVLSAVPYCLKKDKYALASGILLYSLTLIMMVLMWVGRGLYDEAIFVFPTILIIAILLAQRIMFLILLLLMSSYILLIAYLSVNNFAEFDVGENSFSVAITLIIVLFVNGFCVSLLSNDVKKLLARLMTENKRVSSAKEEVEKLVHYDVISGLPNRVLAKDRFEQAIKLSRRNKQIVGLIFVDVDHFKAVNDGFGHNTGDQFLVAVGHRLMSSVRQTDTVSRLGGDEFIVICPNLNDADDLRIIAQKMLENIAQPVAIDQYSLIFTASLGISFAPDDGEDFDTLLKKSDMAMYRAKEEGRGRFSFYDQTLTEKVLAQINLISDIRIALEKKDFQVYYQPKIDLKTGRITGAEALIRWDHVSRGFVPPDIFIPVAESAGLINEIGRFVLKESIAACKMWLNKGWEINIAVNVSSAQFKQIDFVDMIISFLHEYQVPGNLLELELTEGLLIDDSNSIQSIFKKLNENGIKLAIDDFGTGYSNLGYIKKFAVSTLKIDRSFVLSMYESEQDLALVKAIIQVARSLNLNTVAEGIEDKDTELLLTELDCEIGQGYFWSKAVTFDEFVEYVNKFNVENK